MLKVTVLLDVDDTSALSNKSCGKDDTGYQYNEALFAVLKNCECTEIYLFTHFNLTTVSHNLEHESAGIASRLKLTRHLKKQGFKVQGVITPLDLVFDQGIGAYYKKVIKPYEKLVLEGKDIWLDSAAFEAYKKACEQETELGRKARDRGIQLRDKGSLYQYFIEGQRNALLYRHFNVIFVDDRPCHLDEVRAANKKYNYPLCLIQAKPQDTVAYYEKHLSDFQYQLEIDYATQQLKNIEALVSKTSDKTQDEACRQLQQEFNKISTRPTSDLLGARNFSVKATYFLTQLEKPEALSSKAQNAAFDNPLLQDKQAERLIKSIKAIPGIMELPDTVQPDTVQSEAMLYGLEKPYGVSLKTAKEMLRRINKKGNSSVGRIGNVFFKQDPTGILDEQAVYQLSRLFGEGALTATRLLLLEIPNDQTYALQASLGVGVDANLQAIDLGALCQIPETIAMLKQVVGEVQLVQNFELLLNFPTDKSVDEQLTLLLESLLKLDQGCWPVGLKEFYNRPEPEKSKLLRDVLQAAFQDDKKAPLRLLALLKCYPALSKNHLNDLIVCCDVFECLKFLYPNLDAKTVLKEAEGLLNSIPKENLSVHMLSEMVSEPHDHKRDNSLVQLRRGSDGNLIGPLEIIAIDNDVAMGNVFESGGCKLRLMLNGIGNFADAVKRGDEIVIANVNGEIIIFYKNVINGEIGNFSCSKNLKDVLLRLSFDGKFLPEDRRSQKIYEQVYEEVRSQGGCTLFFLVKSFLFANSALLNEPIAEPVRERCLLMNPKVAIMQWLEALNHYYEPYYALKESGVISEGLFETLRLKEQVSVAFIGRLLERLETIQNSLKQGVITHRTLWCQVDPLLAYSYQVLRQQYLSSQGLMDVLYKKQKVGFLEILREGLNQTLENGKTLGTLIGELPASKNAGYRSYGGNRSYFETLTEYISNALTINHPLQVQALTLCARLKFYHITLPSEGLILSPATFIQAYRQSAQKWMNLINSCPKVSVQFQQPIQDPILLEDPLILYYALFQPEGPLLVEALLACGVAANEVRFKDGLTPLHFATSFYPDCIPALILGGAQTECIAEDMTPLDMAMRFKQHKSAILLLQMGAGRNLKSSLGLEFINAYQKLFPELCQSLLSRNLEMVWELAVKTVSQTGLTEEGVSVQDIFKVGQAVPKDNIYGVRRVKAIHCRIAGGVRVGLHLKEYPEMPGREIMVHVLAKHLFGLITPSIALWRFTKTTKFLKKEIAYPVLASRSIEGENLFEVLLKKPEQLKSLDKESVCAAFILALMTNPEDGRPDNHIVEPFPDGYRLVNIDNDHAFVQPIALKKSGEELTGAKALQVKTILYCLEEMREALPPEMVTQLLAKNPYELLKNWLNELQEQQEKIDALFTEKEKEELLKTRDIHLNILFKFKSIVAKIYGKLCRLQTVLKENPKTSLMGILRGVIPELWIPYAEVFSQYSTPLARFDALTRGCFEMRPITQDGKTHAYPSSTAKASDVLQMTGSLRAEEKELKEETEESCQTALVRLAQLDSECGETKAIAAELQQGKVERFKNLPSILQEKIVNGDGGELPGINFDTMLISGKPDTKRQQSVFSALCNVSFRVLKIKNFTALTNRQLAVLLQQNKSLLALNLEGCVALTDAAAKIIESNCPRLQNLLIHKLLWLRVDKLSLSNLRALYVQECTRLVSWEMQTPSKVERLYFKNCPALNNLSIYSTELREVELQRCPTLPEEQLLRLAVTGTSLKKVALEGCLALSNVNFYQKYPKLLNLPLQDFSSEFVALLDVGMALSLKDFGMPAFMMQPAMIAQLQENMVRWQTFKKTLFFRALLKALADQHPDVRKEVCDALSKLPLTSENRAVVVPKLLKVLGDEYADVKNSAVQALSKILPLTTKDVSSMLSLLLTELEEKETSRNVKVGICEVLPKLPLKSEDMVTVVPKLLKVLEDAYADVRSSAAQALSMLLLRQEDFGFVWPKLLKALEDENTDVRSHACNVLSKLPLTREDFVVVLPILLKRLGDKNSITRSGACEALSKLPLTAVDINSVPNNVDVLKVLGNALQDKDEDADVRSHACEALPQFLSTPKDVTAALKLLLQALKDDEPDVRSHACNALSKLGLTSENKTTAVTALTKTLEDKNGYVSESAKKALLKLSLTAEDAATGLPDPKTLGDKDLSVKSSAEEVSLRSLLTTEDKTGLPKLLKALGAENETVRHEAAQKLLSLPLTVEDKILVVLPTLLQSLEDESVVLRIQAVKLLVELYPTTKQMVEACCQKFKKAYKAPIVTQSADAQPTHQKESVLNFNAQSSHQQMVVSGQGNHCALFALVLGLKKVLDNRPAERAKTKLPAFFNSIDIALLQSDTETKATAEIGVKLRQEMYDALLQDAQYKARCYHNFLACCSAFLEGAPFASDMQLWLAVTRDYRESLKQQSFEIRKDATTVTSFVESDLIHHWGTIYQNYCEHVKATREMLSAEELGCLARYWQIKLKIQFAYGEPYTTSHTVNVEQPQVILCNPTQTHWCVVCDAEGQFDMRWEPSRIVALISTIENVEYKAGIVDAINNKIAYAQRSEDCSYIEGVVSAIQEPHVLLQQDVSLSAADLSVANTLSQYFELGLLRLNAERVYSLTGFLSEAIFESLASAPVSAAALEGPSVAQSTLFFDYKSTMGSTITPRASVVRTRTRTMITRKPHTFAGSVYSASHT